VSRRHPRSAGSPPGADARPSQAGDTSPRTPGAFHIALAVIRNAVGLIGVLFLGWSTATLVVLYFADTIIGMWAVFAAVGFKFSNADPRQGFLASIDGAVTGIGVGLFLAAVVVVPLGIPVVMVLGASGLGWRQVAADPALRTGIGVIAGIGLLGAVRHVFALADGQAGDVLVKRTFAILMTRWVLVLMAIYLLVGLLGRFGLYVIVLVYAAASLWSELAPERFARLIPDRRPAGSS
jgi:Family of unknown function (DUF6498)